MKKTKQGFTLIELLVVIAIIGLLAGILVPAVSKALTSAQMSQAVSAGKSIYTSAFAGQMDDIVTGSMDFGWPDDTVKSSHEYFLSLVTNGLMEVSFDFFSAGDLPRVKSQSDYESQGAKCTAWKLVTGLDTAKDGTPFIFTRNYDVTSLPDGDASIEKSKLHGNDGKPFGENGLVVVMKGGASVALKTKVSLKEDEFNRAGKQPDATLGIVEP